MLRWLPCSQALLQAKEKVRVRMATLGESHDPALPLLHPLLRPGPSCGVPQPLAPLPITKAGQKHKQR